MAAADHSRAGRRPTLETVAARAGVSKSLASLVLRDSPKVSPSSREAVLRAVAELGYRPNTAARQLAERQSRTVGVLLNDLRQPWFADMLDGLTPALQVGGKHVLLGDGRVDRKMDETLTWSFLDLGVDGLVLAGSIPMSQAIIDVASKIPTVAVGGRGLDLDLPHVDVLANDNHLGAALAVRHLVEFGHSKIAHISGLPSVAGRLRMEGYEATMRAAGLAGRLVIEAGDMSEEGGYRAAVRLLSRLDRPTAIFAANDLTCVGALSAAAALGVAVPGELSLVGFDNSVLARLRALWLTSVDGTAYAMGQQAAKILLARIEHPDAPGQTILIAPRLEVRGSSGPLPPDQPNRARALFPERTGCLPRETHVMVPIWYHHIVALNLRLDEEDSALLRALADAEHVSLHEAALRAIRRSAREVAHTERVSEATAEMLDRWGDVLDRLGRA